MNTSMTPVAVGVFTAIDPVTIEPDKPAEHSVYSASSSKRWMACPASIAMSAGMSSGTNPAAELGTAAHELGEFCLRLGINTYECIGFTFNDHEVDAPMCDAVQLYVSYIRDLCNKYGVNPMLEERVIMTSVASDVYGTSDCIVIVGDWLFVLDYKHGFGVVEVTDNPQAIFYAIATLDTFDLWGVIRHIELTIIQPRADHIDGSIRSEQYTIEQLINWRQGFSAAVTKARAKGNTPVAGEHCKYCPARGFCRARMERTLMYAFGDKPLNECNAEEIAIMYDELDSIKTHIEAIRGKALELARNGATIKGYKLVKGIQRASCPEPEEFVKAALLTEKGKKLKRSDFYHEKVIGMTDAKKLVPAGVVNKYFVKPPGTTTLVPLNNSRAAVGTGSAVDIFSAVEPVSAAGIFGEV